MQVSQEPATRREAEELREAIARSLQTAEPGEAIVIASELTEADVLLDIKGEKSCREEEVQRAHSKAVLDNTSRKRYTCTAYLCHFKVSLPRRPAL